MNVGYFLFGVFTSLLSSTTEAPIEGSTLPPEPTIMDHAHGSHIVTGDSDSDAQNYGAADEENRHSDFSIDRRNHSKMLTLSTTLGYDEWWFLTTRRPQIFLKDFPGRPGVATWREISPGSSTDNRKSRKMDGPTAASVSSSSQSFASKYHHPDVLLRAIWILFLTFCLCWT